VIEPPIGIIVSDPGGGGAIVGVVVVGAGRVVVGVVVVVVGATVVVVVSGNGVEVVAGTSPVSSPPQAPATNGKTISRMSEYRTETPFAGFPKCPLPR